MSRAAALLGLVLAAGCAAGDETLSAYGAAGRVWVLERIGETPASPGITLDASVPGRIAGQGPCNTYSAEQTAPYPWFSLGPIAATRRACPDMAAEAAFFDALRRATIAEVSGDLLILSNTDGLEMVFRAR